MKNAFKSTIRTFARKPVINLINLGGLAVSLALVIILSLYCYAELTTDTHHKNIDRVYLYAELGESMYMPGILKEQIDLNVPEVESTVRIAGSWEAPAFQVEDKEPVTSDIVFADDDFFELFTYRAIEGNLETALKEPLTIVITKYLAGKLFGVGPALGKTIKLNNNNLLTVSAVIDGSEGNSCLSFNSITSMATRKIVQPNEGEFTKWEWANFQMFIMLKREVTPKHIANKILKVIPDNSKNLYTKLKLNPFANIYFSNLLQFEQSFLKIGDKTKVMVLLMVAILVLIIALVNFINISLSQWMEKIRQTGVLKVMGARKGDIFKSKLFETLLFFLLSFLLALLLVWSLSILISQYTRIHFNPTILVHPTFLLMSISVTLFIGIISSILQLWHISSSKVTDNLKATFSKETSGSVIRGTLVTFQFIIAIVLIAFTILIQKQVKFGSNDLGLNKENIIGIKLTNPLNEKKEVLKQTILEKPGVSKVSFTQYFPGKTLSHWTTIESGTDGGKTYAFDTFNADEAFFDITGLEIKEGRFYKDDLTTDKDKLLVNETFVRENKLDNAIGMKLMIGVMIEARPAEIIGVIKDFHYKSFDQPIGSLVIRNNSWVSYCLISLNSKDFNSLHTTIKEIKEATARLSPGFPVEISFMDQAVEKMYQSEISFRKTFMLFSSCAIFICCLGILAMSQLVCQQRTKEIGIRKVNGARTTEVMSMLNRDFIKWVAIAFVIACPIAWYAMHKWLGNFAYKTALSWWVFAGAGAIAMVIALLTVSFQSWRAATRNPVESLRYE
ncbi:MAG: FtsX-like permease family protein [Bacteroidales bacterium]|nr:FtsX-like permease family protein [Bacteroidales bacterium]